MYLGLVSRQKNYSPANHHWGFQEHWCNFWHLCACQPFLLCWQSLPPVAFHLKTGLPEDRDAQRWWFNISCLRHALSMLFYQQKEKTFCQELPYTRESSHTTLTKLYFLRPRKHSETKSCTFKEHLQPQHPLHLCQVNQFKETASKSVCLTLNWRLFACVYVCFSYPSCSGYQLRRPRCRSPAEPTGFSVWRGWPRDEAMWRGSGGGASVSWQTTGWFPASCEESRPQETALSTSCHGCSSICLGALLGKPAACLGELYPEETQKMSIF